MEKDNIDDDNGLWEEVAHSNSVVKNLVRGLLQAEKRFLEVEIKEKNGNVECESLKVKVTWIDQFCDDFLSN